MKKDLNQDSSKKKSKVKVKYCTWDPSKARQKCQVTDDSSKQSDKCELSSSNRCVMKKDLNQDSSKTQFCKFLKREKPTKSRCVKTVLKSENSDKCVYNPNTNYCKTKK